MSEHSSYSEHERDIADETDDFRTDTLFRSPRLAEEDQPERRDAENLTALHNLPQSTEYRLADSSGNLVSSKIYINAQLRGRFSQSDHPASGEQSDAPELIFYRRNKFKVVGTVSFPGGIETVQVTKTGQLLRVTGFRAELDAIESLEGAAVRVLQSPPKDKESQPSLSHPRGKKTNDSLSSIRLAYNGLCEDTSASMSWEKLQFRYATAKKRGTWQCFYLRVSVRATLEDGTSPVLCRAQSAPITVRGRSPQSFHDTRTKRIKSTSHLAATTQNGLDNHDLGGETSLTNPINCSVDASDNFLLYNFSDLGTWHEGLQWQDDMNRADNHGYSMPLTTSSNETDRSSDPTSNSSDITQNMFIQSMESSLMPSIPDLDSIFNLPNPLSTTPGGGSQLFQNLPTSNPVSGSSHKEQDKEEDSDEERSTFSYEYIPLSINDWTVPVDAVYRPHGVHARKTQDSGQSITKKRYFLTVK